jgi:hypothetical protein
MEFRLSCRYGYSFSRSELCKYVHRKSRSRYFFPGSAHRDPFADHPSSRADALFFLDSLEHLIPILPPQKVYDLLPVIRKYLQTLSDSSLHRHLESAHSVFLGILARGDILHDEILPYLELVYTVFLLLVMLIQAFPQALSPRQVRLALSTVVKSSPPTQVNIILTNLLQHAQSARPGPQPTGVLLDEQLTYFYAFVDCLRWVDTEVIESWLGQLAFAMQNLKGQIRDEVVRRIWECVSGEMGGESGMKAVAWWVNGGMTQIMNPRL